MAQWVLSSISLPNMVITMNTVAPLKSRIKNKLILVIFQIPTFEIGPIYIFGIRAHSSTEEERTSYNLPIFGVKSYVPGL